MFKSIKQLLSRKTIENTHSLHRLKKYFSDPALWKLNRDSIARGVAIGLFTGLIPIMPFHMILGSILAIFSRANLPITLAATWVNNPITFLPLVYYTSKVGQLVLGEHESKVHVIIQEFTWKLGFNHEAFFTSWLERFGKDFLVGLPFVAIGAAVLGYLIVILVWYVYAGIKKIK